MGKKKCADPRASSWLIKTSNGATSQPTLSLHLQQYRFLNVGLSPRSAVWIRGKHEFQSRAATKVSLRYRLKTLSPIHIPIYAVYYKGTGDEE